MPLWSEPGLNIRNVSDFTMDLMETKLRGPGSWFQLLETRQDRRSAGSAV